MLAIVRKQLKSHPAVSLFQVVYIEIYMRNVPGVNSNRSENLRLS